MYTYKTKGRYESVVDYVTVGTETIKSVNDNYKLGDILQYDNGL